MVVLGLGLGSVMQVLIRAAQNAVDAGHLGVVTSGSVLFREGPRRDRGIGVRGRVRPFAREQPRRRPAARSRRADGYGSGGDRAALGIGPGGLRHGAYNNY
jgi:hypothetical protein